MIKQEVIDELSSVNDIKILNYLIEYNGDWLHNVLTRSTISIKLGIAHITIKTILRRLLDQGHLIKVRRGVYKINKDILV